MSGRTPRWRAIANTWLPWLAALVIGSVVLICLTRLLSGGPEKTDPRLGPVDVYRNGRFVYIEQCDPAGALVLKDGRWRGFDRIPGAPECRP